MLKIMGMVLTVLCGCGFGIGALGRERRRLRTLGELDRALGLMSGEIELCSRPLPEIFLRLSENCSGVLGEFFCHTGENCGYVSLNLLWCEGCRRLDLGQEGEEAMESLGAVLGAYDAGRQCAEINLARIRLKGEMELLSEKLRTKCRSWPIIGACSAAAAAIMLI